MTEQQIYKDLPTDMTVHPIKGDLTMLTDETAVKRSIMNLLFTSPYERFYNPDIGAGLKAYLFENISIDTEYIIKEKITEVITNYEKRARLISVQVKAQPDENSYFASITFSVNNFVNKTTLDLVLKRVR